MAWELHKRKKDSVTTWGIWDTVSDEWLATSLTEDEAARAMAERCIEIGLRDALEIVSTFPDGLRIVTAAGSVRGENKAKREAWAEEKDLLADYLDGGHEARLFETIRRVRAGALMPARLVGILQSIADEKPVRSQDRAYLRRLLGCKGT